MPPRRQDKLYQKRLATMFEAGLVRIPKQRDGMRAQVFLTSANLPWLKRVIDQDRVVLKNAKTRKVQTACCRSKNRDICLGNNVWFCAPCFKQRSLHFLDPQRPHFPASMENFLRSPGFNKVAQTELLTDATSGVCSLLGVVDYLACQPIGQNLDGSDGLGWLCSAEEVNQKSLSKFYAMIRIMTTEPKKGVEIVFTRHEEPWKSLRIWAPNELRLCDYIGQVCDYKGQVHDCPKPTAPLLVTTETWGQVLIAKDCVLQQVWTQLMAFATRFGELAAVRVGFHHHDDVYSVRVRECDYLPLRLARDAH